MVVPLRTLAYGQGYRIVALQAAKIPGSAITGHTLWCPGQNVEATLTADRPRSDPKYSAVPTGRNPKAQAAGLGKANPPNQAPTGRDRIL
jgi:hypothetical protein